MRAAIFMMQKNEGTLLRAWVRYHSTLVGMDGLTVFDNMSDDATTIDVLRSLEMEGLRVVWHVHDFEKKGVIISDAIKNVGARADWCFPLDCDEFLAVRSNGLKNDQASIKEALSAFDGAKPLLRVNQYVLNVPYTSRGYWYGTKKLIVRGGYDIKLDKGFHLYSWEKGVDMTPAGTLVDSPFVYLHYHNKTFSRVLDAARAKLQKRISRFDRHSLANYVGDGRHLAKYFLMSEMDYLESFPNRDVELDPLFSSKGMEPPFCRR